jgi:hypothetical protein
MVVYTAAEFNHSQSGNSATKILFEYMQILLQDNHQYGKTDYDSENSYISVSFNQQILKMGPFGRPPQKGFPFYPRTCCGQRRGALCLTGGSRKKGSGGL